MSTQHRSYRLFWAVLASMMVSGFAVAAEEQPSAAPAASKELRAKMATLHEQIAACLRSDKTLKDCRSDMMKGCQQVMGEQGCPMMGMGSHHHMMKEPPAGTTSNK